MNDIWHDSYGALHNVQNPTTTQTENSPLFWGNEIVFKFLLGELTWDDCNAYVSYVEKLSEAKFEGLWNKVQRVLGWNWMVTPDSTRYDFSKDNWIGVALALLVIKRFCGLHHVELSGLDRAIKKIRLFHPQLIHPVAWCTVAYAKYQWRWCLPIVEIGNKISCKETHKVRGERLIAKTDGKIMALMTWIAFGFPFEFSHIVKETIREHPLPVNNKKVYRFQMNDQYYWKWFSWKNLYLDYFPLEDFPLVKMAERIDIRVVDV